VNVNVNVNVNEPIVSSLPFHNRPRWAVASGSPAWGVYSLSLRVARGSEDEAPGGVTGLRAGSPGSGRGHRAPGPHLRGRDGVDVLAGQAPQQRGLARVVQAQQHDAQLLLCGALQLLDDGQQALRMGGVTQRSGSGVTQRSESDLLPCFYKQGKCFCEIGA